MPRIAFEDFAPGAARTYAGPTVTREELVAFAREYDPQPFHIDEEAARKGFFGSLVGSGWHACALMMRVIADAVLLDSTSMGAPGIEETRWLTPLRPGDSLRVRQTILEAKASRSRPKMGLVHIRSELLNQDDAAIIEQTNWSMFGRRGAEIAPFETDRPRPAAGAPLAGPGVAGPSYPPALVPDARAAPYFDDLEIGQASELGSYGFAADDIIAFARRFDPQPFHVDVEAGRRSHFGELCASGWHTGAIWMKMIVQHRKRVIEAVRAAGGTPAQLGPSPGFKNLRWSKPVYVGDTISYRSVVAGKRPTASRPEWGLVFFRNSGTNQLGEEVFSFDGCAFWQRKPA